MYITVDPGAHPGWCIVNDSLAIVACGINKPPRAEFKVVLVERPTIYPKGVSNKRVDPANIITLAITLGKLVNPLEELGAVIKEVEPRTWKGQIPKPVHHRTIRRDLPKSELLVVDTCLKGIADSWCEDAMDAVGLAMYGRRMKLFC